MSDSKPDTAFLLTRPESARILARASRVARTAVAAHRHEDSREIERITGCGGCVEACAYVAELPWGGQACRRSREAHADLARKRGRPVPYLCHMGFACVAMPALPGRDQSVSLTFGPFCPAETPDALEHDALAGLFRLEHIDRDSLPFDVSDIPRVHAGIVPEVAEWTSETLMKHLYSERAVSDPPDPVVDPGVASPRKRARSRAVREPYEARALLAAIAGGDQARLRTTIRRVIGDSGRGQGDVSPASLQDRTVATVAAVLEAAECAGVSHPLARERFRALPDAVAGLSTVAELARAALRVLAPLKRAGREDPGAGPGPATGLFTELDRYVQTHLAEGITLAGAAGHLGVPPSTLTRQLQRRYGASFTEYAGRIRVDRAKELLSGTRLSVELVAQRVGLKDGSHLRKLFEKFEGQPPSAFRGQGGGRTRRAHSS